MNFQQSDVPDKSPQVVCAKEKAVPIAQIPALIGRVEPSFIATRGHLPNVLKVRSYDPHRLKQIPSRVLIEEDYVDILESIVQREFFPNLHKLRLKKALLEAQSHKDSLSSLKLRRELHSLETANAVDLYPSRRVKLLDGRELEVKVSSLSLQEFQSFFTSEDNASFERIITEEKKRLAKEQSWIEASAVNHNNFNAELRNALKDGKRPAQLIMANVDARNPLMFPLTDANVGLMELQYAEDSNGTVALCLGHYTKDDNSSALLHQQKREKIRAQNTRLEFGEDSEKLYQVAVQRRANNEKQSGESNIFDAMVKHGIYEAIDLIKKQEENKNCMPLMPSSSHIGTNVSDTALQPTSRNGYEFLKTPVFNPGSNMSPLMTWGSIAATPLLISSIKDNEDLKPPVSRFTIPDPSPKERAAMRLADCAAKKLLKQKAKQSSCLRNMFTPLFSAGSSKDLFGTPSRHSSALKRGTPYIAQPSTIVKKPCKSVVATNNKGSTNVSFSQHKKNEVANNKNSPTFTTDNLLNF